MKEKRNDPCFCGSGKKYKKCCLILEDNSQQIVSVFSEAHDACDAALAKIEAGDFLNGEFEAERLYDLYPNDHMVQFLQGICATKREYYQDAIFFFEEAIQINPWFCEAYFNAALLYRKECNVVQSIAYFRKIIEIEGEHGDLGKLAKKEIEWLAETIQKTSGETLENYLKSSMLFNEAFTALRQECYEEALSLFQQVLALNPNHVQSHGNIALAYSALGKQELALQYLDKALLLDPTYEPAQQNRELISKLKEGEKNSFPMEEILYYKEKLTFEEKLSKKPQKLSWSPSQSAYVHTELITSN
ncbi:MAG: tetratricopeptide repeat protein [Thaumarchaeota archaeon]|nr:tetratricopeptide repeat protein [Nitrososphaerota archaeon]